MAKRQPKLSTREVKSQRLSAAIEAMLARATPKEEILELIYAAHYALQMGEGLSWDEVYALLGQGKPADPVS